MQKCKLWFLAWTAIEIQLFWLLSLPMYKLFHWNALLYCFENGVCVKLLNIDSNTSEPEFDMMKISRFSWCINFNSPWGRVSIYISAEIAVNFRFCFIEIGKQCVQTYVCMKHLSTVYTLQMRTIEKENRKKERKNRIFTWCFSFYKK